MVCATHGLGLFSGLRAGSHELLAAPAEIVVDTPNSQNAAWRRNGENHAQRADDGAFHWGWSAENGACARVQLACRAEYDGYVECVVTVSPAEPASPPGHEEPSPSQ